MSTLPDSWCQCRFMDVFDIQGGTQPPKSVFKYSPEKGYIRLLQIRDFGAKPVPTFIPQKPSLKTCKADDILIGRYGASIGRICTGMEGAYNVALAKVMIPQTFDQRFVFRLLQSPAFQHPILDIERSAQDGFNKEDLAEIALPVAPINEQRRIVDKLDKVLTKVDACKKRLDRVPLLLKRFRQAVLAAACSGKLTADWRDKVKAAPGWIECSLADICSSITDGDHLPPPKVPTGIPFLTIGNISSGKLDFSVTRFVPRDYFERIAPKRKPRLGDTLYTVVGATIGIPVFIEEDREFCFQRHIALLRPGSLTSARFLNLLMQSKAVFDQAWLGVTGTAQPTLPLTNLRTIRVSIPGADEQEEIVHRVTRFFTLSDQLEARYIKAKAHVDKLTQSILAKAFRGELVPQDPNDEPASVLLERIKSQRTDSNKKSKA